MPYDRFKHRRRSIRLKGYDYSLPGPYLLTISVQNRLQLFGRVLDGEMRLNYYEHIIRNQRSLQAIRGYIEANPANRPQDELYEALPA